MRSQAYGRRFFLTLAHHNLKHSKGLIIISRSSHRIIEANLIIICGSTPTLRRFFRHVAPSLIGDSASRRKSSNDTYQHDPALVTFGRISNRGNYYARFGEEGEEMMYGIGNSTKIDAGRRGDGDDASSLGAAANRYNNDASSDRAIITETVTVSVEYDTL